MTDAAAIDPSPEADLPAVVYLHGAGEAAEDAPAEVPGADQLAEVPAELPPPPPGAAPALADLAPDTGSPGSPPPVPGTPEQSQPGGDAAAIPLDALVVAADRPVVTATPPEARRRSRRSHRRNTRKRRTLVLAGLAVVGAVAVPVLGYKGARTIADSKAGKLVVISEKPPLQLPSTPAALLVVVNDAGKVDQLVVFSQAPEGKGGYLYLVPAGANTPLPGSTTADRLGSAYEHGGLEAMREAAEQFLQVGFDTVVAADRAQLRSLFAPFAPLNVQLATAVSDTDKAGRTSVVFKAGAHSLSATEAASLIEARAQTEAEVTTFDRRLVFWQAFVAAVRAAAVRSPVGAASSTTALATSPAGQGGGAGSGDLGPFVRALAHGSASVLAAPARPMASTDGQDRYFVDTGKLAAQVAMLMPGAVSSPTDQPRVRLMNGTGTDDLLYDAARRLVFGKAIIVVAGNAKPVATTTIEYDEDTKQGAAQTMVGFLGAGKVGKTQERVDGLDLTITLGADYASMVANERVATSSSAAPSTTVASSIAATTTTKGTG